MSIERIRVITIDTGFDAIIQRIPRRSLQERMGANLTLMGLDLVVVKTDSEAGVSSSGGIDSRVASLCGRYSRDAKGGSYVICAIDPDTEDLIDIPVVLAGMLTGSITEVAGDIALKPEV